MRSAHSCLCFCCALDLTAGWGYRDAGWGRNQETVRCLIELCLRSSDPDDFVLAQVSEDPFLGGAYGAEFSLGMQYDKGSSSSSARPANASAGELMAVATLKHVLAYSVDDWSPDNYSKHLYNRISFDAKVSEYDLEAQPEY